MVWGITDDSHKIVGTTFDPWTAVVRKQPLQLYLNQNLSSHAEYKFHETNIDGHHVVLLIVAAAQELPVEFKGQGYGRVDSHKVEFTSKYKYLERQVWEAVRRTNFEDAISLDRLSGTDVINLLDLGPYSDSFAHAISSDPEEVLETLKTLGAIYDRDDGKFQITNLGALLFAKDLQNFPNIARKAVRVRFTHYQAETQPTPRRSKLCGGTVASFVGSTIITQRRVDMRRPYGEEGLS